MITLITMRTLKKVHVIPLGFERSVAVKPVRAIGGSRVHIITIGEKYAQKYELYEEQKYFNEVVKKDFENMGIEVKIHYTDLFDFKKAIFTISSIIIEEKNKKNEVYVNLSSHGRFISIVSAIAGWYHNVRVYYVFPDRYARNDRERKDYGRSVCETMRIFELPRVEFVKLSEEEKFAISLIYFKIQKNGRGFVWLNEIKDEFPRRFPYIYPFEENVSNRRKKREIDQRLITKINRRVLDKLESKKYIMRDKIGRNTILKLTEFGEFLALLEVGQLNYQ